MAGPGYLKEIEGRVGALAALLPDAPLAVALSGGPDSAVAGWVALRSGRPVRAVHVDHGLPGSPLVRRGARAVAESLGLPFTVVEVSVPEGPSPEGQARDVRYAALLDVLGDEEWLVVGHTRTDQAETVLGNLLRGAGPDGLSGIPERRDRIVRPLLSVSRSDLRELATFLRVPWVEDPANLEVDPRRNIIRRETIPYLAARFNPAIEDALVRSAAAVGEQRRFVEEAAATLRVYATDGAMRIAAPALVTAPPAVAASAIRRAIRGAGGPHAGEARDVAAVMAVARNTVRRAQVGGGIDVIRDGVWVVLRCCDVVPAPVSWSLPGTVGFGRWRLEAWVAEAPPQAFPVGPFVEVFDADDVPSSVTVRIADREDRVTFAGGHKTIRDVLSEARIGRDRRRSWPVVAAAGTIIWVPGVRRGDFGWVRMATTRYLWVRATREDV